MTRVAVVVFAGIILTPAAAAAAQNRPDFSGTWTIEAGRGAASGGGGGGGRGSGNSSGGGLGMGPSPTELRITQNASSLTIDQRGGRVSKVVYRLDGADAKGQMPAPGNSTRPATFKSVWKDSRLVTTIATRAEGGGQVTYQEVRYLDADGFLIVEMSIPGQGNARRTVYKKKTDPQG
jgi:hypothetical protein